MLTVNPIRLTEWHAFKSQLEELGLTKAQWLFRGHSNACWPLVTALERARRQWGLDWDELPDREAGLVRNFKRHYHRYSLDQPDEWNYVEWLSLMQHHGVPTRLLDWTYSVYAASYFALETSELERPVAVWAINGSKVNTALEQYDPLVQKLGGAAPCDVKKALLPERLEGLEAFGKLFASGLSCIFPLTAYRLNERMIVQQGVFLCPGDITRPFEENLTALLGDPPPDTMVRKFELALSLDERREAMKDLRRMNVTAATLFPGLDGFARSLAGWLPLPAAWLPPDDEYRTWLDNSSGDGTAI